MTNADLVYQNGPWNPTPRDILARRAFIKRTRDGTPNIGNTIIRIPIHSYNTPIIGRLPPSAYATASITHKSLAYGTKKKPQAGRRSLQRLKSKARPEDQPQDDRDDFIERYNREINASVDTLMTDTNPAPKPILKSGKKFDVEEVNHIIGKDNELVDLTKKRTTVVLNTDQTQQDTKTLISDTDKKVSPTENYSTGATTGNAETPEELRDFLSTRAFQNNLGPTKQNSLPNLKTAPNPDQVITALPVVATSNSPIKSPTTQTFEARQQIRSAETAIRACERDIRTIGSNTRMSANERIAKIGEKNAEIARLNNLIKTKFDQISALSKHMEID